MLLNEMVVFQGVIRFDCLSKNDFDGTHSIIHSVDQYYLANQLWIFIRLESRSSFRDIIFSK